MKSVALLYSALLLLFLLKETEGFTGPIPGKRVFKAKVY